MCLAIPGKIIEIEKRQAIVQYPQEKRKAYLTDDTFKKGDYVMVQMGLVVKKINANEAKLILKSWKNNK